MQSELHHMHKRKRKHEKLLKYPNPNKYIRFLDRFLVVVAIIGPLLAIPQIYNIFVLKDASGIATVTFASYAALNIPWLAYGIVHKAKPIYITYCFWIVVNASIAIGSVIY